MGTKKSNQHRLGVYLVAAGLVAALVLAAESSIAQEEKKYFPPETFEATCPKGMVWGPVSSVHITAVKKLKGRWYEATWSDGATSKHQFQVAVGDLMVTEWGCVKK